jgi:hypothetical protein
MPSIPDLSNLKGTDLQRAVLETFVKMRMLENRLQGAWTHVRYENRGGSHHWVLLDADDDGVRCEQDTTFGDAANRAMSQLIEPFIAEQNYELARVTIRFSPPKMNIDVLTNWNTPIVSGELIDLHLEEQVRSQLALMMGKNR